MQNIKEQIVISKRDIQLLQQADYIMKTSIHKIFLSYLDDLKQNLLNYYKDNLSALVLFGSAVRGDLTVNSDIDLLIILQDCKKTIRERLDEFYQNIGEYLDDNFDLFLSPIIVTIEEAKRLHPIYFGIVNDYKILYDINDTFSAILIQIENLKQSGKIKELELNGRQYWRISQ
ncbi:MAG: nucleotidyltransferase domain-containing protein [Thermodesulfovibrionales bacterium]|nr:nucleotidyltransferase domain-containing protein [Thermodesulfovibrionales bacterium]